MLKVDFHVFILGNNELSLHEFEKYYTHLLNTLFGHGHGR